MTQQYCYNKLITILKQAVFSRTTRLVVSWLLGIILAGIVIYWLGYNEIIAALKSLDISYVGLAFFIFLVGNVLRVLKWQAILHKQYRLSETAVIFFSSKLGGSFLPGRLGEFAPLAIPRYRTGRITALIIFDRVFESYATLFTGAAGFVLLEFSDMTMTIVWFLVMGVVSVVFFAITYSNIWNSLHIRFEKHQWLAFIFDKLEKVSNSLKALGRYWLLIMSVSLAATVLDFAFIHFLFRALGHTVSLPLIAVAWCTSVFVALVSITPGGLGIADASYIYLYHLQGIPSDTLGAFFIVNRSISLSMPILLFFLVLGLTNRRGTGRG